MINWTEDMILEAANKVVDQACKDQNFRSLCHSNIHEAIRQVSGIEVPANIKINVVDNMGYHLTLMLPPLKSEDGELSESELESVAGGSKTEIPSDKYWVVP